MICGSSLAAVLAARWCGDKLFYFYAYDQQARNFPAISTPDDPNFYALTPTQRALLGNRGVTAAKVNAALNYLDESDGDDCAATGPDGQFRQGGLAGDGASSGECAV